MATASPNQRWADQWQDTSPKQSWADFVDEVTTDVNDQSKDALAVVDEIVLSKEPIKHGMKLKKNTAGIMALADGEPSAGSAHHRTGRCKPCAFFHTKGCQNDKACQFCHLCPPGEKQRRKRLRERMCEKLGQCLQRPAAFDRDQSCFKSGHRRQASGTSTSEGSTRSTSSSWTQFSHSRQSSSSSVPDSTGVVGTPICGMPHMHQMMPVYHFAQNVMSPMGDGAEAPMATASNGTNEQHRSLQEADASQMTTTPLALAQVLPLPENPSLNAPMPATAPGQIASGRPAPWQQHHGVMVDGSGVQYALVPVAVPMPQHQQHAVDQAISYGCFAQQSHSQMAAMHGEQPQWCVQAGANFAQPIF